MDVRTDSENRWEIRQYDHSTRRIRSIIAISENGSQSSVALSRPKHLNLTTHGKKGYSLSMELIEAEPLKE